MIHIVDHRDSFTWNVVHQLSSHGEVCVVNADDIQQIDFSTSDLIVFSPGPGEPADYPESIALYNEHKSKTAILGICLGFQLILSAEGASVSKQDRVLHGVQTRVTFNDSATIYKDINGPLHVGRYHSLCIDTDTVPSDFIITAEDETTGVPLSFEHSNLPIFGFQYHPDSFLTDHGKYIISNLFCELGRRSKSG